MSTVFRHYGEPALGDVLVREEAGFFPRGPGGSLGKALLPADDGKTDWRDAEVVNVREYRILGDDSDETTELQALLDAIAARSVKPIKVQIPLPTNGTHYKITAALDPGRGQICFEGAERNLCVIKQYTADTPVFRWDDDTSGTLHSIRFAHLALGHNANPTTLTTQQYGVQFRSNADGSLASGNGYYLMVFEDLFIDNCYVGIGSYATGTGTCPIWGTHIRDTYIRDTAHNAIKFDNLPSTGVLGQPANSITNLHVLNYDTGNVTNDDYAVKVISNTGLLINGLNVEDWRNRLLYVSGGTFCVVNGLRTERFRFTTAGGDNVIYCGGGQTVFNGVDFEDIYVMHSSGAARLIRAEGATGAKVVVNGMRADRDGTNSTTSGTVSCLWAPAGSEVYADAISPGNGVSGFLPSSFGDGQHGIVRYNGLPPAWDAAPTAAAAYRGRMYQAQGGEGVADVLKICLKDAADAYNWKDAVTG